MGSTPVGEPNNVFSHRPVFLPCRNARVRARLPGIWVALDNVRLYHGDPAGMLSHSHRGTEMGICGRPSSGTRCCSASFRAGNLKCLDFEFYRGLENATAKRLYRFLDKRFYRRKSCQFGLKELAWEHIGLARNYDVAGLKRRLRPGIVELEEKQFLQPLPDAVRFQKLCAGEWTVCFERARPAKRLAPTALEKGEGEPLAEALVMRGVASPTARRIVEAFDSDRVGRQIEVLDWLLEAKDPKVSRNRPHSEAARRRCCPLAEDLDR